MRKTRLASGLLAWTMVALTLLALPGCGDDEDCAEDGEQCVSNSDCCDGSCQPTSTAGVYRCR